MTITRDIIKLGYQVEREQSPGQLSSVSAACLLSFWNELCSQPQELPSCLYCFSCPSL